MRTLLTLTFALFLSACGIVELPESTEDVAVYYVSTNALPAARVLSGRAPLIANSVAIAYMTPDGMAFDTLRAPDTATPTSTTWTARFDRDALSSFSITATNLTLPAALDTTGDTGFVGVALLVNQKTVAEDSSRTVVTLTN